MKQVIIIAIAIIMGWYNCSGQQKGNKITGEKNTPSGQIKVNKVYDDKGNLIRYDSIYSNSTSNFKGDSVTSDSLISKLRKHFSSRNFSFGENFMDDHFFNDSLFFKDPFKDEFFSGHFKFSNEQIEKIFRQMDSLSNRMMKNFHNYKRPQENKPGTKSM